MKLLMTALVVLCLTACAARSVSREEPVDRLQEKLVQSKINLQQSDNPVGRTKAIIRISDIQLTLAHHAAAEGEIAAMNARLSEYLDSLGQGQRTMMESGRYARKKADGFMDLELAMRRQLRELEDIRMALSFDNRALVDHAIATVTASRNAILDAVMGTHNETPAKP